LSGPPSYWARSASVTLRTSLSRTGGAASTSVHTRKPSARAGGRVADDGVGDVLGRHRDAVAGVLERREVDDLGQARVINVPKYEYSPAKTCW